MQLGIKQIYTDAPEITYENVIPILQKALGIHNQNALHIDYLIRFEGGEQPVLREKTFMPDINCQGIDNVAAEVCDFWKGFYWGSQIVLVQRGNHDNDDIDISDAVLALNDGYLMVNNSSKMQEIGDFVEKCGIGYSFIDINMEWEDGESYFTKNILDPRSAFIVKSSYYTDKRPMLGVSFRKADDGTTHYTCFSKDRRFEITYSEITNGTVTNDKYGHGMRSGEENPLHIIPIIEWFKGYDYTGRFEKHLPAFENLNLMGSDLLNGIEQNVMCFWWTNDVEMPKEVITNEDGSVTERTKKVKKGEFLGTFTSPDGKTPQIKPLTLDYDNNGILNNYMAQRSLLLEKCHVPTRADTSGGSTGIAMGDATGWSDAETVASGQELITNDCMMNEVRVVLRAIKESPFIKPDDILLSLKPCDIEPNVRRPKTFELSVKTSAISTLLSHGFSLEDALSSVPLFADPSQVITRSGEGVKKYQETIFAKNDQAEMDSDKVNGDYIDQITNSPRIDGLSKQAPIKNNEQ